MVSRQPKGGQHWAMGAEVISQKVPIPEDNGGDANEGSKGTLLLPHTPGQSHFRGSHQDILGEYCSKMTPDSTTSSWVVFGKVSDAALRAVRWVTTWGPQHNPAIIAGIWVPAVFLIYNSASGPPAQGVEAQI